MHRFEPVTRDYNDWKLINCQVPMQTTSQTNFDPIKLKLYPDDIIDLSSETKNVVESTYLKKDNIPGVLILTGKTYGPVPIKASKNKKMIKTTKTTKFYFKCIPDDKRLPSLLIPYADKSGGGFSKHKINLYVLFRLNPWQDKHPTGVLSNVIGGVDDRVNYYEYELYCKHLVISLKPFNKKVDQAITAKGEDANIDIDIDLEDRRERFIFSIDPPQTRDIDDAMGIITPDATSPSTKIISIYIANVPYWLTRFDLWDSLTSRPSTVYLPHTNVNMLPKKLSEDMISLIENKDRAAFVMDITVDTAESNITNIAFATAKINVKKNFSYGAGRDLMKCQDYKEILKITRGLHKKSNHQQNHYQYNYVTEIYDSHDLVEYYMIMMNHMSAEKLYEHRCGIFRTVTTNPPSNKANPHHAIVDKELEKFINIWKYTSSRYSLHYEHTGHDIVAGGIDKYAQITSPIRRLCDIVNMAELQIHLGKLVETESMRQTIDKITGDIDNINMLSKNIQKVQSSCKLLNYCLDIARDDNDNDNVVEGYIIDMTNNTKYSVYIPSLQLITKIKPALHDKREYTLYKKCQFGIYMFTDEHSFHRKIRVELK